MPNETDTDTDDYRVFTRSFDRVVTSAELDLVLGPLSPSHNAALEEAWAAFQTGLMAWRTKAHLMALDATERLRQCTTHEERADTVVSLLVDQSGSMRGQSMLLAAAAADIAQNFLGHLGCKVEVLGFTTVLWHGGRARRRWRWRLRPRRPGRLCELLHVIYRSADDNRASTGGWAFRAMLRPDLPKENVDGEAILWAASRLRFRPEKRKSSVISDGAAVDDFTLLANDPDILERHLLDVVRALTAEQDVELLALGIGFDVSRYYPTSSEIQTADDLGTALIGLLEQIIAAGRGART